MTTAHGHASAQATSPGGAPTDPIAPGGRDLPILGGGAFGHLRAVAELAKVRLSSLVLVTTAVGHILGDDGRGAAAPLLPTLAGTALCAFGANALNQWAECPWDERMARTAQRPIPSGRLTPAQAAAWAVGMVVVGALVLATQVNLLAAALAVAVAVLYAGLYTPLKRRSAFCTQIGAVCGAIPPMIGWAAARGALDPGAYVLFAILFVWQIPHFLAIDWVHKDDYARGGFRMLSGVDTTGALNGRMAVLYCLALVPVTLIAVVVGLGGWLYAPGALALGLAFLALGVAFERQRTRESARRLFLGSLLYLPLVLGLLVLDPTRPG